MAAGRRAIRFSVALLALLIFSPSIPAQQALTQEGQEAFMKRAKVVRTRGATKGVTEALRATLSDGTMTHDAQIQTIDQYKQMFQSREVVEFNFRDSWRYNVAAYRLNKVLQLGRIPPSIERVYNGKQGAYTWWIDDVMMEEADRLKTKTEAPDAEAWNRQVWHVRIFDQLIYNVDRNLGNLLIDKGWNVWMIDHTRAFRTTDTLKAPQDLKKIERSALERLKKLDAPSLKALMADYLSAEEQKRLLMRRDAIVKLFEAQGEAALFDAATTTQQQH